MVTEHYFSHNFNQSDLPEALRSILVETNFILFELVFQGKIYEDGKLGTSIYEGIWRDHQAALKIQLLQLDRSEIQNIRDFIRTSKSKLIRLPEVYISKECSSSADPGYIVSEWIAAPKIYTYPLANEAEMLDFLIFYKEYKKNTLRQPFYANQTNISANTFSNQRVQNWLNIVTDQNKLNPLKNEISQRYFEASNKHFDGTVMEFMHSHLGAEDIFKMPDGQYVLMSNAFFGYRPTGYDLTFHIWFGLKSLRDLEFDLPQAISYLEKWLTGYKNSNLEIAKDCLEKVFYINFLERCTGAIIIDLDNQEYNQDVGLHKHHLREIFLGLFEYCLYKLN